jgi:ABC-type lipoprotein export system ATPase subunit
VIVSRLLANCARRHDTAVLCATHDASVEQEADEVLRLRGGRLLR